jgi:hypothetical protein
MQMRTTVRLSHRREADANGPSESARQTGTCAVSDRTSALPTEAQSDIEREAARWLAQIAQGNLSPEKLAEFDQWLEKPEHEGAVARLLFVQLDAELLDKPSGN